MTTAEKENLKVMDVFEKDNLGGLAKVTISTYLLGRAEKLAKESLVRDQEKHTNECLFASSAVRSLLAAV